MKVHPDLPNHLSFPWMNQKPRVAVVGIGGSGSQMLTGLARMHVSMRELGHPGLSVTAFDPDAVSEYNVGRQLFSRADIGRNKAEILVNRLNAFFGCGFRAEPVKYGNDDGVVNHFYADILIGCVDTRKARHTLSKSGFDYWLDLGNAQNIGQVILGNKDAQMLPTVGVLFPEMLDASLDQHTEPSCSMVGALDRQDLFINQSVATAALNLLWRWYREGVDYHGCFINARTATTTALPIDPWAWLRMGHNVFPPPLRRIVRYYKKPGKGFYNYGRAKLECGHIIDSKAKIRTHCKECKPTKEQICNTRKSPS